MRDTLIGRRIPEIDGLRAIAVLAVVLYHYFQAYPQYYPYGAGLLPLAKYGDLGVDLFFIVSGFVITLSLTHQTGPWSFAVKRLVRLWPAMAVCSIITFAVLHTVDSGFSQEMQGGLSGFVASWSFTSQSFWHSAFGFDGYVDVAYWTLAVEIRFYLLAAAIFWLAPAGRFAEAAPLVLLLMQSLLSVAEYGFPGLVPPVLIETLFLAYAHLFAAGITFAAVFAGARSKRQLALLFWSFAVAFHRAEDSWEVLFLTWIFLAVGACAWRLRAARLLAWPPLSGLGLYSYSVYLLHNYIGVTLLSLLPAGLTEGAYILAAAITLCGILFLSRAVYELVEVPAQRHVRSLLKRSARRGYEAQPAAGPEPAAKSL